MKAPKCLFSDVFVHRVGSGELRPGPTAGRASTKPRPGTIPNKKNKKWFCPGPAPLGAAQPRPNPGPASTRPPPGPGLGPSPRRTGPGRYALGMLFHDQASAAHHTIIFQPCGIWLIFMVEPIKHSNKTCHSDEDADGNDDDKLEPCMTNIITIIFEKCVFSGVFVLRQGWQTRILCPNRRRGAFP